MISNQIKRNWDDLIGKIKSDIKFGNPINQKLIDAIETFCTSISTQDVVFASKNSSGTVWRATPVVKCFCDAFNPAFEQIFTKESSYTYDELFVYPQPIDLSNLISKKEDFLKLSTKLLYILDKIEHEIDSNPHLSYDYVDALQNEGDTLRLIVDILDSIHTELRAVELPKWCRFCFRRANNKGKTCDLHVSTEDRAYRKARRIRERFSKEQVNRVNTQMYFRKLLNNELDLDFSHTVNGYTLHKTDFDNMISVEHWGNVSKVWDAFIEELKFASKRIKSKPSEFEDWKKFCEYLKKALNNEHENNEHPYWIAQMLLLADLWFDDEDSFVDKRCKPKPIEQPK